ncbi:actin polymerization [Pyrenophora seminiperda CCB06]|uniref:Protein BZZ1 n=1 Tax=Pyrenophora seminiperda CCB06 TaxID=1302712 RepID=A0A3M7M8A8_9PLEO|nr:actin polymerization [Pyrenophora seminiperda CCB06]
MEVDIAPQFGAELKDGFKTVNAWVSGGISWLDDIQQFYRERSAIEKEYAAKLSALAKKYFEKKAKKQTSLSVGDTPTVTPGSLESASLTTWGVQLNTLESRAAEHDQFAGALITQLADPLKILGTRTEELRKLHGDYAAKLEKERDHQYSELRKQKGKYDSVCQEVESRRKKVDGAFDHGKGKARNAFEQQQVEMRNVKNTYLISINVTNKQKEMYYHEYVPELLDSLQDLSETRVNKLNTIWSLAAEIETQTLMRSTDYLKHLTAEIPRNNPLLDSMMFVRHNVGSWQEPGDFQFEPSPVWLDDNAIAVDESATVFLRNVLTKSKASLAEHRRELEKKRKEVEVAKTVRQNIREGKDKRDEVDIVRSTFAIQEQMHEVERQKVSAEVEVSTITSVVGDVSIGARNHNFKSQTFKIPTNCDLCGDRIWGLSAKGFDCQDCGYTCHSKCEMKVPADCPGEQSKVEKKKLKEERQKAAHTVTAAATPNGGSTALTADLPRLGRSDTVNSMNTLSSGYSATAQRSVAGGMSPTAEETPPPVEKKAPAPAPGARKNRIVAPPPAQYIKPDDDVPPPAPKSNEVKGKMLYAYQENGEGEITVTDGMDVTIVEPDDGSGWTKVRSGHKEGLVPAAYVEVTAATPPTTASTFSSNRPDSTYSASSASTTNFAAAVPGKKKGPAVAPKRGAKKLKYVEALYDYTAQSDVEHSMSEGDRFVLINMEAGDGWADVEKDGVVRSVPANYVQQPGMKLQYIVAVAALAMDTAAKPHHLHRRAHSNGLVNRAVASVSVPEATQTLIVYKLDGKVIAAEEADRGIANGTLKWGNDHRLSTADHAAPTPPPASKKPAQIAENTPKSKTKEQPKPKEQPKTKEQQKPMPPAKTSSSSPAPSPAPGPPPKHQPDTSSNPWANLVDKDGHCSECDKVFPNGKIRCTEFPYGYGALPTKSQGLGGWSGIQDPQYAQADGFDDIKTVVKDSCSDGTCCTSGSFCSYGCPNPYLKASFPARQGRTGQSVGGLYCNKDGYLEMADGKIADTLCVQSSTHMSVKVHNKLSKSVSFCRTDYPGTESMTFPVTVGPGETGFLANPDQNKYFFWKGMKTSAQYYVNKQGVPENEACTWGTPMGSKGNWAPAVFGTSFDDGPLQQGFSSLKQNELCKKERLGYDITFVGDGVVSPCRYKSATNQWCEDDKCWEDPDRGCTASLLLNYLSTKT